MKMVCFCEKAHFRFIYTRTCYITTHPIYRKTKPDINLATLQQGSNKIG